MKFDKLDNYCQFGNESILTPKIWPFLNQTHCYPTPPLINQNFSNFFTVTLSAIITGQKYNSSSLTKEWAVNQEAWLGAYYGRWKL